MNSAGTVVPEAREAIRQRLAVLARERGVRILYAAEAGSRAWGYGGADSDYDVRFIYAHPIDWYLRLAEARDVIEAPLDQGLDIVGWDVRKALRLLLKSNPTFYEWLVSPVIYGDDGKFRTAAKALFEKAASPRAIAAAYWSQARGQWRREIEGRDEVQLKQYFYVVRPLLALRWVLDFGTPPPMDLARLAPAVGLPLPVSEALGRLTAARQEHGGAAATGPRIPDIDAWTMRQLELLAPGRLTLRDVAGGHRFAEAADELFRNAIGAGPHAG